MKSGFGDVKYVTLAKGLRMTLTKYETLAKGLRMTLTSGSKTRSCSHKIDSVSTNFITNSISNI